MADTTAGAGSAIVPIRTLVISTAFSMLISLAVFAVSSMLFVFPVIEVLRLRVGALSARVDQLERTVEDIQSAPAPAPAAPTPPAVAVAPAPSAAGGTTAAK